MSDTTENAQKRIYILGVGSIGMLIAHSLRGIPDPPPVSLLFHRIALARDWEGGQKEIKMITDGHEEARTGFDGEMAISGYRRHGKAVSVAEAERLDSLTREELDAEDAVGVHEQLEELSPHEVFKMNEGPTIHHVVITVKAPQTVSALSAIKHRLTAESTILFLQNGMGIIEEVNEKVFTDPATRPHYLLGINSHGAHSEQNFVATHAGLGTIALGLPVRRLSKTPSPPSSSGDGVASFGITDAGMAPSSRYLFRTITRTPVLAAVGFSPTELLKAQLDKLAVNCVINPLTALLDCRNGMLLHNMAMTRCMRLLISEISSIFIRLPELEGLPNTNTRFSPERLETLAVGVAGKTGQNISSMLADVRKGRQTEINYINGYVVKRGEELGIHAGFNYMVSQLAKGKTQMVHLSEDDEVPFVRER